MGYEYTNAMLWIIHTIGIVCILYETEAAASGNRESLSFSVWCDGMLYFFGYSVYFVYYAEVFFARIFG